MTHDWITTLLALGFFAATAAFFVVWSKLEEEKVKTREERECYEAMPRLHNGVAVRAQELQAKNGALKSEIARLNQCLDTEFEFADEQIDKNRALQDRLSALLCPSNNHIWKDGVCAKCGRMKDA